MRRPILRRLLCVLFALACGPALATTTPSAGAATAVTGAAVTRTLVVGVDVSPPFVITAGNGYTGLAMELWQQAAKAHGWKFRYQPYDFTGLLKAVRDGQVDVGLGAITATAQRTRSMDFTHPIASSGLGVAVRNQKASGWLAVARALVSWAFLKVIIILAILLLIVGFLVWLFEHKHNPEQFGGTRRHGIFSGFWWAMVTMTTVGYGDTAPRTVGGRILGLFWMLSALIIVSFFTASITSSLTVGQLSQRVHSGSDLAHMRVASIPGTTSGQWLAAKHIHYTHVQTLDAALADLAADRVDAVVFDKPLMRWDIQHQYRGKLNVLPLVLERQDYAIALARRSPLRKAINESILSQINSTGWIKLKQAYFGDAQ